MVAVVVVSMVVAGRPTGSGSCGDSFGGVGTDESAGPDSSSFSNEGSRGNSGSDSCWA